MRPSFVFLLVFCLFSDVSAQYVHSPKQRHIAGDQATKRAAQKTTNANWRLQSYSKYYDNGQGLEMTDSAIYYYSADRHSEFDYMEMQYSDWGLHSQVSYDSSDIYMNIGNGIQLVGKYSCLYDSNSNKSQFTTAYNLTGQFENRDMHNVVFNINGQPAVEYWLNWNIATNNWDTSEIHSYTYDVSGRLIADSVTNGLSGMPSEKSVYVYDANGNMIESTYSFWVGQWAPNRRESYTYYPGSKVKTILTEENKWQNWVNVALDSFGYGNANEYTYKLLREWDTAIGSWNYVSLETRTINTQDLPEDIFLVEWDFVNNSWDSTALAYCNYDTYGNISRIEGYTYINGTKNSTPEYAANYYYGHYFNVNIPSSVSSDADIQIYPNPVSSDIVVDGISKGSLLRILNVAGVQVYSGAVENRPEMVNLSYLQPGVYILNIIKGNRMTYTHRFIKQ